MRQLKYLKFNKSKENFYPIINALKLTQYNSIPYPF